MASHGRPRGQRDRLGAVAAAYRGMLEGLGATGLDDVVMAHTVTEAREGSRVLRPYFRDETGRWV